MVMALDTANFFIRDLGALRFGTAATRPLLLCRGSFPKRFFKVQKAVADQMPFWSGLRSLSCNAGKGDTDIRKKAQNCVEGAVEEAMEERVFQSQSRNQVVFV